MLHHLFLAEQKGKTRSSAELRKKEKEMRRLQQEMQQEREKYNQLLLKYQDLQSQVIEDSHVSFQLFCLKHPPYGYMTL